MKWLALIYSLYFIFLFTLPCIDNTGTCAIDNTREVPHSHDDKGDDIPNECSPFCFCSCCSISVVLTSFHLDIKPVIIRHYTDISIYQSLVSGFIPSVWEPPKLV